MKYTFTRVQNMMYEEEFALMYGDDVIIQGDNYHDKIYEKIDGFIEGVEYLGNEVELFGIEIDNETNPSLFDELDFYDGE